ncbi:MAG TPA: DUF2752 domain-containing protein [Egibacteraceae bacterium]|nr:DUF2752 domain-containing protein [Egibacteraceae bacterium]
MDAVTQRHPAAQWALPALVAGGAALSCAVLALVDPNERGNYPLCPFLALTGKWCPGCGSLRGVRALLYGDPVAAVSLNPLMVLAIPYVLYTYLAWASERVGGPVLRRICLPATAIWRLLALVGAFWVARNIPAAPFSWLAP